MCLAKWKYILFSIDMDASKLTAILNPSEYTNKNANGFNILSVVIKILKVTLENALNL